MTQKEAARLLLGLRAAGWNDTDIVNFTIWVETGDNRYKPANVEDIDTTENR